MIFNPETFRELAVYDAGLLNDYGGGDVGWWQDYLRAELGRAYDFYASQIAGLVEENARLRKQKAKRLPPLPRELYEGYPAMSAQAHEHHVKEYARAALTGRQG